MVTAHLEHGPERDESEKEIFESAKGVGNLRREAFQWFLTWMTLLWTTSMFTSGTLKVEVEYLENVRSAEEQSYEEDQRVTPQNPSTHLVFPHLCPQE